MKSLLSTLVQKRRSIPRWPSIVPGVITLVFAGPAYEDGGLKSAFVYLAITALSVIQTIRPTVLGWGLLVIPFLWYAAEVAMSPENGQSSEWVIFMSLGFIPVLALIYANPWKSAPE